MSAEDGLSDTIKPKLENMQADCTKIFTPDELLTLNDAGMEMLETI